jgi:hypothetical protein
MLYFKPNYAFGLDRNSTRIWALLQSITIFPECQLLVTVSAADETENNAKNKNQCALLRAQRASLAGTPSATSFGNIGSAFTAEAAQELPRIVGAGGPILLCSVPGQSKLKGSRCSWGWGPTRYDACVVQTVQGGN